MINDNYTNEIIFRHQKKIIKVGLYAQITNFIEKNKLSKCIGKKAILTFNNKYENAVIEKGIFNQPVVKNISDESVDISITHTSDYGIAVAFPSEYPIGIDLEKNNYKNNIVAKKQMTEIEKNFLGKKFFTPIVSWTAKEALSKILKTGLTTPFRLYELSRIEKKDRCIISHFKNFSQYEAMSIINEEFCFTIVYPRLLKNEWNAINLNLFLGNRG